MKDFSIVAEIFGPIQLPTKTGLPATLEVSSSDVPEVGLVAEGELSDFCWKSRFQTVTVPPPTHTHHPKLQHFRARARGDLRSFRRRSPDVPKEP